MTTATDTARRVCATGVLGRCSVVFGVQLNCKWIGKMPRCSVQGAGWPTEKFQKSNVWPV